MFDIGFSELLVIGIVALVVIGPERLPKVARTAGHMLGRLQRYVTDIKADISREMQLDELKKMQAEMQDSVRQLETTMHAEMRAVEEGVEQTAQSARAAIDELTATFAEVGRAVEAEQETARNEAIAAAAALPEQTPADALSEISSLAPPAQKAEPPAVAEAPAAAITPAPAAKA